MAASDVLLLVVAPICYRVPNFYFSVYFMQSAARQCHLYQTVPEQHPWRAKSCKPRDTRMVPKLAEGHLHVMNLGFQAIRTTKISAFPPSPGQLVLLLAPFAHLAVPHRWLRGEDTASRLQPGTSRYTCKQGGSGAGKHHFLLYS